jgi:antitoxin ParD1/3/4
LHLKHDIVLEEHSSSQLFENWSALLIKGGAILLPAPPFLLSFCGSLLSCIPGGSDMNEIKLTREYETIIQKQIDSGRYDNATDVIEASLSLLEGFDSLDDGDYAAMKEGINASFDDGSDDIPLEDAFRHIEAMHERDKAAGAG